MRRILSSSVIFCLASGLAGAQSTDDFDDAFSKIDAQFEEQTKRIDDIYQAVDEAIDRAYKGLTKKIEVRWPDGALPERHKWVTYNKQLTSRATVDYERGEIVVETLVQPDKPAQEQVQELLAMSQQTLQASSEELNEQDMLRQAIDKEIDASVEKTDQPVLPPKPKPVAVGPELAVLITEDTQAQLSTLQTTLEQAKPQASVSETLAEITPEPVSEPVVEQSVAVASPPEPKQAVPVIDVVEEDGATKLKLRIAFVNDYQEKLISQYFEDIKGYADQYDVPVSVVMAIIETESSYNPRAVSPIPAFGLMQLVPRTAGVDAHQFVHGEKKILTADYLFEEDNNLQLGSAYFHLLTHRYLRKIDDPTARFYCAVASYNTGVGNLARTFTGSKSINAAVTKINQMSSQQVYDFLLTNLPAEETRNYLRKVVTRMEKYKQFDARA